MPPSKRHSAVAELHAQVVDVYLGAVGSIQDVAASQPSSDGRTIGQVVGHIAEWEPWVLQAGGEIASGVVWPRIMELSAYVDIDGQVRDFRDVEDFNAFQATKQARWPWSRIQALAVRTATAVQSLFVQVLAPEYLEETRDYTWELPGRVRMTLPCGWYLRLVTLEHEAVEHADDLKGR